MTNTAIQFGAVFKEIHRELDCKDDMHIRVKEKEKEALPSPSDSELKDYIHIITAYSRFIGTEEEHISIKAREFAQLLFLDFISIAKDSDKAHQLETNKDNLFHLADIETTIQLSNTYKNEFQQQLQIEASSLPSYSPSFS